MAALSSDSRLQLIWGGSGGGGIDAASTGLEEGVENVRSSSFLAATSYHSSVASSTGKTPTRTPHSVVMFEIVSLSSDGEVVYPFPSELDRGIQNFVFVKRPA